MSMASPPPFVVFALPRSRTTWLSRVLTYGPWACGHDEIRHLRGLDDVKSWFSQPWIGTVETGASAWWRLLPQDCRVVVLRRPRAAVLESLAKLQLGLNLDVVGKSLIRMDAKLDQISTRWKNSLNIEFDELSTSNGAKALFEYCLQLPMDNLWWEHWNKQNLQINLGLILKYYSAHLPQLARVAAQAKQKILREMQQPKVVRDDITIAQESFTKFYQDGKQLFAQHLTDVGEAPSAFAEKNLELLAKLDSIGALQILVARSNGRMFGYLMTIIAPSLESPSQLDATHLTFFADPTVPGVGLRLQREARAQLAARGVDDLFLRAGPRGSGPRLGALYSRMGAVPAGQMFQLHLGAA